MKKRVLAVVLCLAMLIGYVPYFAFTAQASNSLNIYQDGVLATSASLPQNKSVVLDAFVTNGSQYQWQILIYGDNWVNITGGAGSSLKVTYAMIASLCNGGAATLRVKAVSDGAEVISSPFTVYVTDPVIEPTEDTSSGETYVIQDAPDAIIHDTTAATTTPTEAATEAPTEAATEASSSADLEAAEAAYAEAAAAYDLAAADLAAKQTAYEAAAANRAAAEAAVQASAVVTTTEAVYGTDENGETYEISPATTTVTYDEALVAAAEAAAAEEAAALEARNAAQTAATQAEANKAAAESALTAAKSAAEAASADETQSTDTTPVSQTPSSNFSLRGSSNYTLSNEPAAQAEDETTASEDEHKTYSVVVNYVSQSGSTVYDSYTATLAAGSPFSATVTFPTVLGYLPYLNDVQQNSLELNYTAIDKDYTFNVVYKPTNVEYTVKHYQQNVYDDGYTEVVADRETLEGLTESVVPDVANTYEGFYALLYEKPNIAADGSTVVEIYYDRYYYLMNFDLGGGYGVEPIYARYGTPIGDVGTPVKEGYAFMGWNPSLPSTMPAESKTYVATWGDGQMVDYTVVYWKENANDSNYSFWGQVTKQAVAGSTVSGSDDIPTSITTTTVNGNQVNERVYFTYNAARTNKDVVVNGDGTSVVNVYYYRNTYHLYFYGISGTCAIEEHTHGDGNCNSYLDCIQDEHVHGENCSRVLTCTRTVHEHDQECYGLTCGQEEHEAHTADCLICGYEEHDHATNGCSLKCGVVNHSHSKECYGDVVGNEASPGLAPDNPSNGQIYKGWLPFVGSWSYIYINGTWYEYTGSLSNGEIASPTCGKTEETHVHTDSCYDCGMINHSHSDSCYKDTLHEHSLDCYSLVCGQAAHTHDDTCYTYTCGGEEHTHTSECYRPCTKLEHTHTNTCNQSSSNNVIWVINAKYEQNIADVWPTADKFTNYTLHGWTIDGINNSTAVSKRVSMTADLCDTSDNLKYAKADSGGNETTLYYMFESFDQTSTASGDTRKYRNGTYYDSDPRYYQVVNSSGSWNQKAIEGMTPVSNGVETSGSKVFLYYNRNRSDLTYTNSSDGVVKTVSSIMYEQPLANYTDSDGNLLSAFVPSYPSKLEPNAFEFAGWYTTPECYPETKFDFTTATMPNGDLALYAYWKPVTHTVEFYLDANALAAGTKLSTHPDVTVSHRSFVTPTPADPTNGGYTFVGWFYLENGVEKAFDFENMPVIKDLQVYAKWSSNELKEYTIYYKIKDTDIEIAAPTTGSALAGTTKTFDAKGGTDLYADYQEGYFPVTKSHSLTIDINATEENNTNVYIFWYVQKEAVPYTVKYLDKETGEPVATEKTVSDNRKAVVTETFVPVSGMMPDAYQKRLVVSVDENGNPDTAHNVIIFYYTKDTTHAYYKITHYTENVAKDTQGNTTWTEYASSEAVGDIGTIYSADPMTIPGFTYDESVTGTVKSGELTANGLELKLYYTRNSYPYQVRYLEQGTGKQLADPKDGTGKYGQVISESAIDITNYTAVDPTSTTLTIRIEENATPALNIITFYYTEKEATIHYEVVGPDGCGTVSPTSETLKVLSGDAQGSTAAVTSGSYKFVGWYSDAACTNLLTTNSTYTPTKAEGAAWVDGTIYYAKFEWNVADLTITKSGARNDIDENQSFIFTVTGADDVTRGTSVKVVITGNGSVTIKGLLIGSYTVTEDTNWSWRYDTTSGGTVNLVAGGTTITFNNSRSEGKWLSGDSVAENQFKINGSVASN